MDGLKSQIQPAVPLRTIRPRPTERRRSSNFNRSSQEDLSDMGSINEDERDVFLDDPLDGGSSGNDNIPLLSKVKHSFYFGIYIYAKIQSNSLATIVKRKNSFRVQRIKMSPELYNLGNVRIVIFYYFLVLIFNSLSKAISIQWNIKCSL